MSVWYVKKRREKTNFYDRTVNARTLFLFWPVTLRATVLMLVQTTMDAAAATVFAIPKDSLAATIKK